MVSQRLLFVFAVFFFAFSASSVNANWSGLKCNNSTGNSGALPLCSLTKPCLNLNPLGLLGDINPLGLLEDLTSGLLGDLGLGLDLDLDLGVDVIAQAQFKPSLCKYLNLDDGAPLVARVLGKLRYYCQYIPEINVDVNVNVKVPLVLWFGGNATSVYAQTKIRALASSYNLSADVSGFALVSFQPQNHHVPSDSPLDGLIQDLFFLDPLRNSDYIFADLVIDALVSTGIVDPLRIYIAGWGNGAAFGIQYGVARSGSGCTAQGNKIAAVSVFGGFDPYLPLVDSLIGNCQIPYPKTSLPIYLLGRDCDLISCSGVLNFVQNTLKSVCGNLNVKHTILNKDNLKVVQCATKCVASLATKNHLLFPSLGWQKKMLDFLAINPLDLL